MAISGNDPTGGAGIAADIEAIASMGCQTAPVITALTVQDTHNVLSIAPTPTTLLIEQARAVFEDMPIAAVKIGMTGSIGNIEAIHTLLRDYPETPVILDPILAAGGGTELSSGEMVEAMVELLLPQTTILTPNSIEARRLAPNADTLDACAQEILATGCELVLITGAHEESEQVENTLYGNMRRLERFSWERLPHSYHGSGCTLAAAIAGLMAQGLEPFTAINEAQEYAWESLRNGYRSGMGQHHPNRFFWAWNDPEEGAQ
ncbi:hydroxymethylpyrimidine/phosphomethylpyrimidine kinase [Solemya pervernicosa gill symbiont]|uniref:hydroxymethylpyrimidine kinase n=2 Tax=Gammaproteobacteria incertae sedis TaxID=118884 RepID=A0A1T2L573_9GAMM|nr:hydroxymethylpyrimidine/phosphomethylpyrimidine kinase [Candidatus Reidiella endopervernicosa]OOZ40267.1 hydroxymethylpyrimidine/phosphomethylpyrimidine kinase [Solemya pervernicosa gill symbiont]QKQ28192.1 hydroxymethylpyrimidine/phosphomethylpyrimidine kinase [Candidatus Reidiella endopervernicosa]